MAGKNTTWLPVGLPAVRVSGVGPTALGIIPKGSMYSYSSYFGLSTMKVH